REGGGPKAIEAQHSKRRLTARERIGLLADPGTFFELGIYAASGMYEEWGGAPAAGVITGVARVQTRLVMIIANDATVKAGGFFLAGPALVQAAIGQKISAEELGGAAMHSAISGTVDFREPNEEACIARIRDIIEKWGYRRQSPWDRKKPVPPALAAEEIYGI